MEENKDLTQSMENAASAQNPQTENEEQGQQERAPFRMRRRINNAEKVEPFSRYHQSERDDFERPMRRYNSYSDSHYQRAPRPDRPYSDNQDSYRNDGRPANQWGRANGRNHNEYRTGNPRYNSYNNPYSNSNNGHYQNRYANQENQDSYQVYEPQQQYSPRSHYNYQKPYGEPYNQYDENNGGGFAPNKRRYNNNNHSNYGYKPNGFQSPRGGFRPQRPRTSDYNPSAKYSQRKILRYKEENVDPNQPLRLNKFMANAGICSRREADKYIEAGLVTVNGQVVTELGTKVLRTDEVKFHDQTVSMEDKIYVVLNKPKDYVTTSDDPEKRKTVMDLVKNACPERIYPIGRLDRNTTGVLLLTNDGDMASKLMHPKFLKKKIYHVHLNRAVTEEDMKQILDGVELEDGVMKADAVEYASESDKKQVGIEIHSGKNRIVRRIFEHLGYRVVKLDRVYFAGLTKKNLRRGQWRFLTPQEVSMLRMGAFE